MEVPELSCIAACIVDYRGYRVLCQSIIPGILSQSPETSAKYGSIDDGATINTDEEFGEIMKQVCEKMCLSQSKVLDAEGNTHEIWGAVDSKGIKGSDQRKYFLEALRLTPRDANYQGEEYSLCLLRPELVEQFQQLKNNEFIENEVEKRIKQKKDSESKEEQTEEEKKNRITIEELQEIVKMAPRYDFNPNTFTNINFAEGKEESEGKVTQLSEFLLEKQVPAAAKLLCNEESWSRIGSSIIEVLHRLGVNARYLGRILNLITSPENKHVKLALERHAVARAAKHVLNYYIRETSDSYLAEGIAHLLNSLMDVHQEEVKESKKKRKRKNKKTRELKLIQAGSKKALEVTPQDLWKQIREKAESHFGIALPESFEMWECVGSLGLRLAYLREVCLQTGVELSPDIQMGQKIVPQHISGFNTKVKKLEWRSMESRWLLETGMKSLQDQNIEVGIDMLTQSAGIQTQVTGYFHNEVAGVYQRLAQIYTATGDYKQGLANQHKAIVVLEKTLGQDHNVVGQCYTTFAYQYQALGKFKRAMKHLLHALQIFMVNNGELSPEAISVLISIGVMYRELGMHETAIGVLTHVMGMCLSLYGEKNLNVAECAQILATEYKLIKDFSTAKQWEQRALDIFKSLLPAEDKRLANSQQNLQMIEKLEAGITPQEERQSKGRMDKKSYLRQKLQARKAKAKLGIPEHQLHMTTGLFEIPASSSTREQIEEEKARQLMQELSKKNLKK